MGQRLCLEKHELLFDLAKNMERKRGRKQQEYTFSDLERDP
jgi:hypothetical protein